jgi:NADPH:quinone reductase-like Zn-dependent oxidoreductase
MLKNRGIVYFGEYEKQVHEQVSKQALHNVAGKVHVLVRVHAISLNPVDTKGVIGDKLAADWTRLRKLSYNLMVENTQVGFDFAGEVVEGRDPFDKGAKVYGTMPPSQGSFAKYIRVPRHQIALAPTNISMDEVVACLPLVGLTGWQALSPQVKPGQSSVLIVGGSGGMGHVAIQIAKALGAISVTAICSTRNIANLSSCVVQPIS